MNKKKDDTILIRINSEDKKRIKIKALEENYKSVSDYILSCCLKEINKNQKSKD